jgi:hypothetical protein
VGLLSHYIKIQGKMDGTNETDGFGGHIMMMKNTKSYVENVELYKMGQKAISGRYPLHWHLTENTASGSYFRNSSVHKSFNRAVTIHGTDYVTVDGIFAYDHIGHGIFLEDGGERFNTIQNNVVFVTRRPKSGEEITKSDNEANAPQNRTPSSYWITNPNNTFVNNVAAGTEGTGFWIAPPEAPLFSSGTLPYFSGVKPHQQPLGRFEGFVAHTCMNGWDLFDRLNADHSLKTNIGWEAPAKQYIRNGMFYANNTAIYCGLNVGGINSSDIIFTNCVFSDNAITTMLAANLTIENSLFNVDTDLGVFTGTREFFRFYDGPGNHVNCHFNGWNRSNAEIIMQIEGGGATENFNPSFTNTTVNAAIPFRFHPLQNSDLTRARRIGQFFKDYDGGFTGKAHTTIVRDIPFLTDGHEFRSSTWKNAARSDYYFASLWISEIASSETKMSIVRTKAGKPTACFYEPGYPTSGTYKIPMIVNQDFLYTYTLSKIPESNQMLLIWYRGDAGDLGFACFKGVGKLGNFSISGSTKVNTLTEVRNSTTNVYFTDTNGDVYLKMRCPGSDNRLNMVMKWDNAGTFVAGPLQCTSIETGKDTDGDAMADVEEEEVCRNKNNASDLRFNFNKNEEGFTAINVAASNTSLEEAWLMRVDKSNDPYIFRSGFKFSGSQVPKITVRAKSEATGAFQLFWATAASPNFSAARSVTVSPTTTNVYQNLVFDMSSNNAWIGQTITQLRLDFPPDVNNNRHTWIDYISGPQPSAGCAGTLAVRFTEPTQTVLQQGDDLGAVLEVEQGTASTIKLMIDDVLVREESKGVFKWGTANPGETDALLYNLAAGNHELKAVVTDVNGKETIVTLPIQINSKNRSSAETDSPSDAIIVYPNPSDNGVFHLNQSSSFEVFDLIGRTITTGKGDKIDLSNYPKGMFIVRIGSQTKLIMSGY